MQVLVVARRNKLTSFVLILGILNLNSEGLKFRIWLKKIINNCNDTTVVKLVKLVKSLNREMLSSVVGMLPLCENVVDLRSPTTYNSRHLNSALEF